MRVVLESGRDLFVADEMGRNKLSAGRATKNHASLARRLPLQTTCAAGARIALESELDDESKARATLTRKSRGRLLWLKLHLGQGRHIKGRSQRVVTKETTAMKLQSRKSLIK